MHLLIDELQPYNPTAEIWNLTEYNSTRIRILPANTDALSKNILYIASHSTAIEVANNQSGLSFICPDKTKVDIPCKSNFICLNGSLSIDNLINLILEIFEKYALWHQRMVKIIITNGSYKELLEVGAEMLINPIALFDPSLTLITYAGELPADYDGTIWEQVLKLGYTPLEYYTDEYKKKVFTELSKEREPYFYKEESDKYTQLNANLFIEKKRVGALGSIDINKPFTLGQEYLVNLIKHIIEAYTINHSNSLFLSTDYDSLVKKMIKGYYVEEKVVQHHLQRLGWKNNNSFYVLIFENVIQDFSDSILYKTYKNRLERFFKNCITTSADEYLISVIPEDHFFLDQPEKLKTFKEFLEGGNMQAGISLNFSKFLDLKYHFSQAVSALHQGKQKAEVDASNEHCFFYKDFFMEDLVQSIGKETSLRSLCHSEIIALKEYDENSGSEYVKTLYHYLLCGRNLTDASEQLHIHRNTLNYRISRIKEILNINIDDYDHSFYLLFSCKLVVFL